METSMPVLSPAETLMDGYTVAAPGLSTIRKYVLLTVFCLAQFLDSFNNSALFAAIPTLVAVLHMTEGESVWLISAFQLTFASFLLISGRISDVYSPKIAFVAGIFALGALSVGAGFVRQKILLIVIRALSGIAASLTIPSALTLIVKLFPESSEQGRAIGVFGGCGAIGNILGLTIGAILVQFASWPWVFWFVALVAVPVALAGIFLIPRQTSERSADEDGGKRATGLDVIGVSTLTAALILFIFAITSGSTSGWGSAKVIAPLVISLALFAGFFYWESRLPVEMAAVPPRTWFYPNFSVLFGVALLPFFWWTTSFTLFPTYWEDVFHWSVISTVVHLIPMGVLAFAVSFTGSLSRHINSKWIILTGLGLDIVATVLLMFPSTPQRYWPFAFPAFVIGSTGTMLAFTHTNIAIFRTSPAAMAGTVGAIFNAALQLGSAVGIAVIGSIEASVAARHSGTSDAEQYASRTAAFQFLLAVVCAEALAVAVFYRERRGGDGTQSGAGVRVGDGGGSASEGKSTSDSEKEGECA